MKALAGGIDLVLDDYQQALVQVEQKVTTHFNQSQGLTHCIRFYLHTVHSRSSFASLTFAIGIRRVPISSSFS